MLFFSKEHLDALKALAAAFDELGENDLSPLETCLARCAIDRAVCETLGIQEKMANCIRWHLVGELSVTGKRLPEGRQKSSFSLAPMT